MTPPPQTETDSDTRRRLPNLHYRWLFPALIFGGMTLPLLLLAYENDESMAGIFHDYASAWAVAMHVAILLFPVAIATLPRQDKRLSDRNVAWTVWGIALVLALIGNVVGSIAHASGRTISEVLNGAETEVGGFVQVVAGLGGFLIIALEFASGRLLESNVARLFFGPSPDDIMPSVPPDAVRVDKPASALPAGQRTYIFADNRPRGALEDKGPSRDSARGGRGQTAGQRSGRGSRPRRPVDSSSHRHRPSVPGQQDSRTVPVSQDGRHIGTIELSQDMRTVVIPEPGQSITDDHVLACEALAAAGSVRAAELLLYERGTRMSKSAISRLTREARELDPAWAAAVLGEA